MKNLVTFTAFLIVVLRVNAQFDVFIHDDITTKMTITGVDLYNGYLEKSKYSCSNRVLMAQNKLFMLERDSICIYDDSLFKFPLPIEMSVLGRKLIMVKDKPAVMYFCNYNAWYEYKMYIFHNNRFDLYLSEKIYFPKDNYNFFQIISIAGIDYVIYSTGDVRELILGKAIDTSFYEKRFYSNKLISAELYYETLRNRIGRNTMLFCHHQPGDRQIFGEDGHLVALEGNVYVYYKNKSWLISSKVPPGISYMNNNLIVDTDEEVHILNNSVKVLC